MADEESRQRGPYTVAYPVDFTPQGDTTQVAFRKHIDEIIRIYGILTGLDAATLDADDVHEILNEHINSTNPHPNYRPSISWNDLTNKPGLDSLSGTLNASKVYGNLSNATIDSGKVNGLSTYLDGYLGGRIPTDKGDGITAGSLNENGYVKFNNGLIIQWGKMDFKSSHAGSNGPDGHGTVSFPMQFPNNCYSVVATVGSLIANPNSQYLPSIYDIDIRVYVDFTTKSYFCYYTSGTVNISAGSNLTKDLKANYIAIGA